MRRRRVGPPLGSPLGSGVVVAILLVTVSLGVTGAAAVPGVGTDGRAAPTPTPSVAAAPADLACPRDRIDAAVPVTEPRIADLYPNPTTHGNVGEFVVLETPPDTRLENWTLTDGHTTAALPNETVSGPVAATTAPNATRGLTAEPVVELEGTLRLAVDGDTIELRDGAETVDAVTYEDAPVAERWYRTGRTAGSETDPADRGQWWPRDATCLPVATAAVDEATAFVLPDAPEVPREAIAGADERLLLAGYTFTDEAIADGLVAAADRGVDVAVLLESSPVGGTPAATDAVLERLADAGVDVRAIGGEGARYRFHHPKYAVADDAVVVTTENWKPSGIGGESSRGWGVRLEDAALADELATVFEADFEGWDTESSAEFRAETSFVDDGDDADAAGAFPTEHEPSTVSVESAELLLAPENAEGRLEDLLASADDEILVKQADVDADVSLLAETLEAARRGIDVEILLDSTWYVADENEALATDLERTAAEEDLPLEVRLVDDTDRFEKIHAKGIVIDREIAVVGSANWTDNSLRNNREVLLALHGEAVASYYADVFEADWAGETWSLPIGLSATVVAALAAAAVVGHRYVRFGDQ